MMIKFEFDVKDGVFNEPFISFLSRVTKIRQGDKMIHELTHDTTWH